MPSKQEKDAGRRRWSGDDPRLVAYRANRRDDARRLRQLAKGLTMAADTATELLTDRVTMELRQS